MKYTPSCLLFFLLCFSPALLAAQCPEFQLVSLQSFQRADAAEKETKILDCGFDLGSTTAASRRYNKCWLGNSNGKTYFQQLIIWDFKANTIQYMTLDEAHYLHLRSAIEERHSTTYTGGNGQNEYIGKMFRYNFGRQSLDGAEYFIVRIAWKA
ncbi:MAG: hypothetical protein ABIQ93_10435 [Saprospiraceae bacterium]